ncbi:hypothetical protein [Arthrobacter sp. Soil736]|uniref:hypothetical protein n=1 Tax=Arthrobacter sp. Soil736 TaxID=1736395 RepID=UPI000B0F61CC|nr:hypothetical protein [Arthrobacter sp. Soil736]
MIVASLKLINVAMTISETQAANRVPLSAWGAITISAPCVLAAAYYQNRLDRHRAHRP